MKQTDDQESGHEYGAQSALSRVEKQVISKGRRMTSVRREVVLKMAELGKPHTAYRLLAALNRRRKAKLSPISLYRTLDFLIETGVAYKIESANAFGLCSNRKCDHSHIMVVCDKCGTIREIHDPSLSAALKKASKKHGHTLDHPLIELHGTCRDC